MKVDKLKYIATPINELKKINPHWAIEENISHLLDNALHPENGRFIFLSVNNKHYD